MLGIGIVRGLRIGIRSQFRNALGIRFFLIEDRGDVGDGARRRDNISAGACAREGLCSAISSMTAAIKPVIRLCRRAAPRSIWHLIMRSKAP